MGYRKTKTVRLTFRQLEIVDRVLADLEREDYLSSEARRYIRYFRIGLRKRYGPQPDRLIDR